ncbi:MAG: PorP/SprF family type IX secretion system membrane protein [Bacteroidetes bacterium]|nr:PorP/SprF family type IX secretion system membrane protein [Bacteroidota bacterium]
MKKYLYSFAVILVLLLNVLTVRGQDPPFSQWFSTPSYYNPAYCGVNSGVRARFLYRDQWPNLPLDFKSYFFSADVGDRRLPGSGGLGLVVISDNEGAAFIHDLTAALNVSVRIPITANLVTQVGIRAGVVQRRVNYNELVFTDMLDPRYGAIYQTSFDLNSASKKVFPDFGAGGLVQFANEPGNITGTIGFAVDHIFKPDESFLSMGTSPLPRKFSAHADFVISTGGGSSANYYGGGGNEDLKINPGVLYQNQDGKGLLEVGFNLLKFNIYLGGWYKNTMKDGPASSITLLAGYRYSFAQDMNIKFMYSYDLQISAPLQGMGGAHEISLILEFDKLSIFGGGGGGSGIPGGRSRGGYAPLECPSFY